MLPTMPGTRDAGCEHVPDQLPTPTSESCQVCGLRFSLRLCATCGHVGCCESLGGHARAHALAVGHPVIVSLPVERGFTWCYEENAYVG
jgi:uncharacterized UBP type Zn finger protein